MDVFSYCGGGQPQMFGARTGRYVTEDGRKTFSLKMFLSNGHIPEDLTPAVMLHGMSAFVQGSPTSSATWYIVMVLPWLRIIQLVAL